MKKCLVVLAFFLPMAVMAQEPENGGGQASAQISNIELALRLVRYGYDNNDALSLIQAARIIKLSGMTSVALEKEGDEGQSSAPNNDGKRGQVSLDPVKLLGDAKALANNDGVLLALIDDVNVNTRGRVGPRKVHEDNVLAHSSDFYNMTFEGGKTACVLVSGDGDTDLDLYIYDEQGLLVAKDDDDTDTCLCRWTPARTATFRIKIVNRGSVYNHYTISWDP